MSGDGVPDRSAFTRAERSLVERLRTPRAVQRWLRSLPYNWEKGGETLRSFRGVVRLGTAHCLEAALAAAVVLEPHGFPPLLLSFESQDKLDHVLFVFRQDGALGLGRPLARPRPSRPQAGLPQPARAGERATWTPTWT